MSEELFKGFFRVIDSNIKKGRFFTLELTAVEVAALHGSVSLAMNHPVVKKNYLSFLETLNVLRGYLLDKYKEMGFNQKEVSEIDALDKRQTT